MADCFCEAPGQNLCALLDVLGLPAVLVDRQRQVLHANSRSTTALGADLQIVNGRLDSPDPTSSAKVGRLVEATLTGDAPLRVTAIRRADPMPIIVHGIRIGDVVDCGPEPRALLVMIDPSRKPLPADIHLRDAFALSPTEVRLTGRLASGDSLQEAAVACNLSYESARTLIKSVYRKTATNRQGALVALVHRMALVPTG